jgi:hypothetical protein
MLWVICMSVMAGDGAMQQDVQQARQAFSDAVLDVLMDGRR